MNAPAPTDLPTRVALLEARVGLIARTLTGTVAVLAAALLAYFLRA